MSCAIVITDVAEQDLHRLIDSLPASRRRDALEAVDEATQRLAANPRLAQQLYLDRRALHFGFRAAGVDYHWGAAGVISEDEASVVITHFFRVPL